MSNFPLGQIVNFFQPRFDWIQVEVTSHCNAACIYCPRTTNREAWQNRHLPLGAFRNLLPSFRKTRLVHLQGWGEPFLNPHFFEMAAMARASGCRVGTTTNAMLLDGERIGRLVESGIDLVAFSLAGTGPENEEIRKGTHLAKVLEAIQALTREKERRNAAKPVIHVAYMLFRSGLKNLQRLPSLLEGRGVSHAVITTLDWVPSEELMEEALYPQTEAEYRELRSLLDSVAAEGETKGLGVHYHLAYPGRRREVCTENVLRALCVSSDGAVTPCVFTNLALEGRPYFLAGETKTYRRLAFGNINEKPLADIWREKGYRTFRSSFRKRTLAEPCQGCPKLCGEAV